MSMFTWGKKLSGQTEAAKAALQDIFPLPIELRAFVEADLKTILKRILTDTIERTHGASDQIWSHLLWDSCVASDGRDGLVTLLAETMLVRGEICLTYKRGTNVLVKADGATAAQIKTDYEAKGASPLGVLITFKNYDAVDLLRVYSTLEHCVLGSMHKTVNISKAVQIKIDKLRESVAAIDRAPIEGQAEAIADALARGVDVYLDGNDSIESATPNTDPIKEAVTFLNQKRAYVLGLPEAYIAGVLAGGLGGAGGADARAVDRGLKPFHISIIKPVLKAIWGVDTEYMPNDEAELLAAINVLKELDLVSDRYMTKQAKRKIIARVFNLNAEEEAALFAVEDAEQESEVDSTEVRIEEG